MHHGAGLIEPDQTTQFSSSGRARDRVCGSSFLEVRAGAACGLRRPPHACRASTLARAYRIRTRVDRAGAGVGPWLQLRWPASLAVRLRPRRRPRSILCHRVGRTRVHAFVRGDHRAGWRMEQAGDRPAVDHVLPRHRGPGGNGREAACRASRGDARVARPACDDPGRCRVDKRPGSRRALGGSAAMAPRCPGRTLELADVGHSRCAAWYLRTDLVEHHGVRASGGCASVLVRPHQGPRSRFRR